MEEGTKITVKLQCMEMAFKCVLESHEHFPTADLINKFTNDLYKNIMQE